jgi:hypothetical protein
MVRLGLSTAPDPAQCRALSAAQDDAQLWEVVSTGIVGALATGGAIDSAVAVAVEGDRKAAAYVGIGLAAGAGAATIGGLVAKAKADRATAEWIADGCGAP